MARNAKPNPPTPAEAYAAARNDIARLLDVLQQELDAHAPTDAQRTWPKVGDLGKVRSDLIGAVGFLSGMEPAEVERFLAE